MGLFSKDAAPAEVAPEATIMPAPRDEGCAPCNWLRARGEGPLGPDEEHRGPGGK